jgi:ATP phosphoribosyltransferase regulatory subunit HisZ
LSKELSFAFRLPDETGEIRRLESTLHGHSMKSGYQEVMVPCQGSTARDSKGALRSDLTEMLGLMVSRGYFPAGDAVRLRCSGPIFRGNREGYQFSAELINAPSLEADIEVLKLASEVMDMLGTGRTTLIIGYPAALREMFLSGGLDTEAAARAEDCLRRHDLVSYAEILCEAVPDTAKRRVLSSLHMSMGLDECRQFLVKQDGVHCGKMSDLMSALSSLPEHLGISVNLGLTGAYEYYTGCVFQGHCSMAGRPVLTGGRYMIHGQPSVGFAVEIDTVVEAREAMKIVSQG